MEIENFLRIVNIVLAFLSNFLYLKEMFGFKRKLWLFPVFWFGYEALFAIVPALVNCSLWVNVTLNWMHILFMACFFCKGTFQKKIVLSSVYIIIILFFEPFLTIILIMSGIVGGVEEIYANPVMMYVICTIEWISVLGLIQVICIITKSRLHKATGKRYGLGILSISVSCMIASFIQCAGIIKNDNITWSSLCVVVLIFVVSLMCYYFFLVGEDKHRLEMEYKVYGEQVKLYSQWIEEQKQNQAAMAAFRHDIKNHIAALKGICSRNLPEGQAKGLQEVSRYLDSIGMNYEMQKTVVNSGSVLMDSILNMKLNYAVSKGIAVETGMTVPADCTYDNLDMVILLGNLLDNAIEACEQGSGSGEKKLSITLKYDKGNLFVATENTYSGVLDGISGLLSEGRLPKTTKKEKQLHGIGMRNIVDVVNKYNGELRWRAENDIFTVEVLLYGISAGGENA